MRKLVSRAAARLLRKMVNDHPQISMTGITESVKGKVGKPLRPTRIAIVAPSDIDSDDGERLELDLSWDEHLPLGLRYEYRRPIRTLLIVGTPTEAGSVTHTITGRQSGRTHTYTVTIGEAK